MKINPIQQFSINSSAINKKTANISFSANNDEFVSKKAVKNQIRSDVANGFDYVKNSIKKDIWFSKGSLTKRHLKALITDPVAYILEYMMPMKGNMLEEKVIGQVQLKNRKTKEVETLDVERASFEKNQQIYSIKRGNERLAFADVNTTELNVVEIMYASTLVGREDYRGLFLTLMQAVVEDYVNLGIGVPEIIATPVDVGNKEFSRAGLYGLYGAEHKIVQGEYGSELRSVFPKEKVVKMLEDIQKSPRRDFIFSETENSFNALKN